MNLKLFVKIARQENNYQVAFSKTQQHHDESKSLIGVNCQRHQNSRGKRGKAVMGTKRTSSYSRKIKTCKKNFFAEQLESSTKLIHKKKLATQLFSI